MNSPSPDDLPILHQLRQRVEAALRQMPAGAMDFPEGDQSRLLHELQVYQAELAMQNEELHRQQRELIAARDTYATLYELAPVGYMTLDSGGTILEVNLAAATLFGVPRSDLVGFPLARYIARDDQDIFYVHCRQVFETQTTQTCDLRLQRSNGAVCVAHLESCSQPVGTASAPRCLTVLHDLIAHWQVEKALRASEIRQRAIVQTAVCGIITIDERGRIESVNPAVERLFGYAADQIIGQNIRMLMPTPYREAHDGYLQQYVRTGERHIIGVGREVRGQRQDGTTFPIALAVSEIFVDGHRVFVGIVDDLTTRVQAEEALMRLQQRYQRILEAAGEGIYGIDLTGRITFVNPTAAHLLGWTSAELIGQPMHALVCHALHEGTLGSDDACPLLAMCRDGTSILVEYVSTPLHEQATLTGAVVVFKDITERKRLEGEMQRADRLALVGQLAAGLAHEIGTPLNIIAGNAELLRLELRARGVDTAEVDTIVQHADRITGLIQQLLTFVRAPAQPLALVAVQDALAKALHLLEARFRHQSITLLREVAPALPCICGRPEQLEQVFLNVLVNAWHAMPEGGTLTVKAWTTEDRRVCLSFCDTGLGMSTEVLTRACEPFYSTKGARGTGLGLAICQQIMDSHRGALHLESTVGVGTTVLLEFPPADSPVLSPPAFS